MPIRQARSGDVNTVAFLFDQYRQFYLQASDMSGAKAFIQARLEKNESVIFLAFAVSEDIPIPAHETPERAAGFVQLYPAFSSASMRRLWILNDLFVAPAFRKQGVGQSLMKHSETFARASGAKGLTLKTADDNVAAQRLYESLGWTRDHKFISYNIRFPNV